LVVHRRIADQVTFAVKLSLAITLVVVVALGVAAAVGGPAARASYVTALENTLAAQVDGAISAQRLRVDGVRGEVERLARSPRVVAAMGSADGSVVAMTAEDELRFALQSGGSGSTFVFLDLDGVVVALRRGSEEASRPIATALGPIIRGRSETMLVYLAVDGRIIEAVVSPVVDIGIDEQLGFLALCLPFTAPKPLELPDQSVLRVGLRVGDEVFGGELPDAMRSAAAAALKAAGTSGGSMDIEFAVAGEPMIAYAQTITNSPLAQYVAVSSLAGTTRAVQVLMVRLLIAGAVALGAGLAIAAWIARSLSRPVADMSRAARAIEKGDYTVRVPVRDRGELGQLATRFNEMGAGLALRDQYRRVLDVVTDPEVAEELLAGKLDLGGSSKDVGVLFCDIRGFTSLTEHMDPPQVIAMLNEHMTLLTKVAYDHGGVVDKFVGDLIMVTFGAPKSADDDAKRMAHCALAMVHARAAANEASGRPIRIGIGCAYGTVVAGCMGSTQRLDYTVLGARVNLAARLCSKAPPMAVYIDAGVMERIQSASVQELPPLDAKGFSAPIRAFELMAMADLQSPHVLRATV
jgi:class 3 adenylate cyclase